MTRLMDRARTSVSDVDLPAASELRERVMDIVESMVDRVSDAVEETSSPRERAVGAARSVGRHTRSSELASAAVIAAAPAIARAVGERISSRRSASMLPVKAVPAVVLTRPALLGLGAGAAFAGGFVAWRLVRRRRRRLEAEQPIEDFPRSYDLDEEVARMQDEGGEPDGAEHAQRPSRRFVRSGDGSGAPAR